MQTVVIFFHILFSILVMVLVLMHSGRDSGLGSIGGGPSGGGQHVMERNLTRLTIVVSLLYVATTITLNHIYT